jgi:predicted DNA-binding transcriptional regulator YafY
MANTSSRALRLLSLLQSHRYWPGQELADRLEVSLRTLRRDVDRLRELGYPVDAQRGVEGGYQLAAGASLPPLVLDDDEAVALAIGLMGAAQSSVQGMAEASVQVLAKVVQVMPKRLRRQVDAMAAMTEPVSWTGPDQTIDAAILTAVAQACRDTERLDFAYTAVDSAVTERRTEPHRLVSVGRRWYLVAYDLTRHDWRIFRLDRMGVPKTTSAKFAPRKLPASDAAEYVRASLNQFVATYEIVAVVQADAVAVRERIGRWATVEAQGGERCEVRMRTDAFEWAALALSTTDAEFSVQGPAEFVDYLRKCARRFTSACADA